MTKSLLHPGHAPTRSQRGTRILLGAFMAYAGVSHLSFHRKDFKDQVPPWLPADPDAVVIGSGVAEIGLGAALLGLPRHFRLTGLALAAFYVLIFPATWLSTWSAATPLAWTRTASAVPGSSDKSRSSPPRYGRRACRRGGVNPRDPRGVPLR